MELKASLHFSIYTFQNDLPVSQDSSLKSVKYFGEHMKECRIKFVLALIPIYRQLPKCTTDRNNVQEDAKTGIE